MVAKITLKSFFIYFSCIQKHIHAFNLYPTSTTLQHRLFRAYTVDSAASLIHRNSLSTSLHAKYDQDATISEEISNSVDTLPTQPLSQSENIKIEMKESESHGSTSSSTSENSLASFFQEKILLGIEPKPEIIAIMTIYFVEGALGLARLAQTFLLKDQLHLGPAEMSALTGLFTLPWTIKPIYGFLSDGFPLFGYRRRSYLVLAGLIGGLSYTALAANFWGIFDPSSDGILSSISLIQGSIGALVVSSACIAFSDVVADGIVVQQTRDSDDEKVAGGLQSLCWGSAALGGLLSAYFSGSLIESIGPQGVFSITAVLPIIVASIALLIDEEPIQKKNDVLPTSGEIIPTTPSSSSSSSNTIQPESIQDQVQALWSAIKNPNVWKPALFMFLWQSTPTGEGAFLYFMTNDLGFGPEFLGRVRLVTAFAGLVGVWIYQKFLRTVPIKSILFWSSIASTPLGLSQLLLISHVNRSLGIPDSAFVFGDDVALSILGEIAFLPTLVLAARLCPPGVEAVLFATLMSIFNGASTVGTEVGAALTKVLGVTENNFENLGLLTLICNLSSLYPLFLIGLLDEVGDKSEADLEDDGDEEGVLDVVAINGEK